MAQRGASEIAAGHGQHTLQSYTPLDPYELSIDRYIMLARWRASGNLRKTSIDDIKINPQDQPIKQNSKSTAGQLPTLLERSDLELKIPNPHFRRHSDPPVTSPQIGAHPNRTPTAPAASAAPTYRTSSPANSPPSYYHKSEFSFEAGDRKRCQCIVDDIEADSPESIHAPDFSRENVWLTVDRATEENHISHLESDVEKYHAPIRREPQEITEVLRESGDPVKIWITTATPQPDHQSFLLPSRPTQEEPNSNCSLPLIHANTTEKADTTLSVQQACCFATGVLDPESLLATQNPGLAPTTKEYLKALFCENVPRQIYMVFLLFLPRIYFSRVNAIFEDAEMTLDKIKEVALKAGVEESNFIEESPERLSLVFKQEPKSYQRLKQNWETFVDNLTREWKTFNVVSVLLLTGILTILQIDKAAGDFYTRYAALFSFINALISLMFGCGYIMQFATMRKIHKGAEWAMEAINEQTIFWNVWVMIALPGVFLAWSMLLFTASILCFTWRVSYKNLDVNEVSLVPDQVELMLRVAICLLLATGILYGIRVVFEFRRYGRTMDEKWRERVRNYAVPHLSKRKGVDNLHAGNHRPAEALSRMTTASFEELSASLSFETLPTSGLVQQAYESRWRARLRPDSPSYVGQ